MKKIILWLADVFNVELTKTVYVDRPVEVVKEVIKEVPVEVVKEVVKEVPVEVVKEVEKVVYKVAPAEGKIVGDVIIEGNVEVQGGMYVDGGVFATKYIDAKEGVGTIEAKSMWKQTQVQTINS